MKKASASKVKRDEAMDEVADAMEYGFDLIGSTAIEDKLQDRVDETIEFMKIAGVKVWVLTGDKIETAINIAFSCKLLDAQMEMYIIDGESTTKCLQ